MGYHGCTRLHQASRLSFDLHVSRHSRMCRVPCASPDIRQRSSSLHKYPKPYSAERRFGIWRGDPQHRSKSERSSLHHGLKRSNRVCLLLDNILDKRRSGVGKMRHQENNTQKCRCCLGALCLSWANQDGPDCTQKGEASWLTTCKCLAICPAKRKSHRNVQSCVKRCVKIWPEVISCGWWGCWSSEAHSRACPDYTHPHHRVCHLRHHSNNWACSFCGGSLQLEAIDEATSLSTKARERHLGRNRKLVRYFSLGALSSRHSATHLTSPAPNGKLHGRAHRSTGDQPNRHGGIPGFLGVTHALPGPNSLLFPLTAFESTTHNFSLNHLKN